MHKVQKCQSGGISLMWRKTAQKAEISEMSISLCFFEDTGIYIYILYLFIYLCQACERLNTNCAFVALSRVPSLAENSSSPFHKNAMSLVDINVTSVKDINHILMPLRRSFNPRKKEKMRNIAMKQWATFAYCIPWASEHRVPINEKCINV